MMDTDLYLQLPSLAASAFIAVLLLCTLLWIRLLNGSVSRLQGWQRHVARAPLLVLLVGFVLYPDFMGGRPTLLPVSFVLLRLGYFAGLIQNGVFPPVYGEEFRSYYDLRYFNELAGQIGAWLVAMAVISWLYDRSLKRGTTWGRRVHNMVVAAGYLILVLWGICFLGTTMIADYSTSEVFSFPGGGVFTYHRGSAYGLVELTGIPTPHVLELRLPGQMTNQVLFYSIGGNQSSLIRRPDSDWCTFVSGWMDDAFQGGILGLSFINTRTGMVRHLRSAYTNFSSVRKPETLNLHGAMALWQQHREPTSQESDYRLLIVDETGETIGAVNFGNKRPDESLMLTAFSPRRTVILSTFDGEISQELPCDPTSSAVVQQVISADANTNSATDDDSNVVQFSYGTDYEDGQLNIRKGSAIWALAQDSEGCILQSRTVESIVKYEDGTHGHWHNRFTTVPDKLGAVFYFRGISLRPGKVNMIVYNTGEEQALVNESINGANQQAHVPSYSFICAGHTYTLTYEAHHARPGMGYSIVLAREGRRQVLLSEPPGDAIAGIYWIGDIDRDNQPDYLLYSSSHYALRHIRLFLSSYARGEELVGQVAVIEQGD